MGTRIPIASLAPRKVPRQRRSAVTVAILLDAAARILDERGLEGFNTNAVAECAGVSIGSLYQYFPSKQALLAALLRAEQAALRAALEGALVPLPSRLEEGVAALAAAAASRQLDRPRLARLLDQAEATLPLDAEITASRVAIGAIIAGFLAAHVHRHGLPPGQAAADLAALARALIDRAGEARETDRAALVARVTRAALGYLLGPSAG